MIVKFSNTLPIVINRLDTVELIYQVSFALCGGAYGRVQQRDDLQVLTKFRKHLWRNIANA